MELEKIKVAAFQFHGSGNIEDNFFSLERGIIKAAKQNVRLLITQECALCGYPPVELDKTNSINFDIINESLLSFKKMAIEKNMYIALGTINFFNNKYFNSVELISPNQKKLIPYSKRALWGWDTQNFIPGDNNRGIYQIDGFKIGIRICYEVRFPEYFRELFKEDVFLALISFCDVGEENQLPKYELIKSHLITRAVENAMYIMSVNSISNHQLAPTCLINPDGVVLHTSPQNEEYLFTYVIERDKSNFGRDGRIKHSKELLGIFT